MKSEARKSDLTNRTATFQFTKADWISLNPVTCVKNFSLARESAVKAAGGSDLRADLHHSGSFEIADEN